MADTTTASTGRDKPVQKPNILLILTDQQQAAAMSCAGNPLLRTPAMDSLAKSGVRFANACTSFPLCVPARCSLFTGRMPSEIPAMSNDCAAMSDEIAARSIGPVFRDAGYDMAYAGKWHAREISMQPRYGFEKIHPFGDAGLAEACVEFLCTPRNRPFFLVASFDNPHNICEHGRDQNLPWGSIPDVPAGQYPNLPPNFAIPPFEPEAVDFCARDMPRVAHRGRLSPERWRQYRHAYFRLVEKVDRQIGIVLEALAESGAADDTLVLFTSDHGEHAGAHQLGQKTFLYDEAVRVPLIVRPPGGLPEGQVRSHLAAMCLDIFPTLCDFCGVPLPKGCSGRSLAPLLENESVPDWRDQIVTQTTLEQCAAPRRGRGRALRTERYKYILYDWGACREQLFDLIEDPGEMVNLAVEDRYAGVLADHRARLHAWMREHGDSMASGTGGRLSSTGVPSMDG